MEKFFTVTNEDNDLIYINPKQVTSFYSSTNEEEDKVSFIQLTDGSYVIALEQLEEIRELIEDLYRFPSENI